MLGINTAIAKMVMSRAIKRILIKQGFKDTEFNMKDFEMTDGNQEGITVIDVSGQFVVRNDELWQWIGKRL